MMIYQAVENDLLEFLSKRDNCYKIPLDDSHYYFYTQSKLNPLWIITYYPKTQRLEIGGQFIEKLRTRYGSPIVWQDSVFIGHFKNTVLNRFNLKINIILIY